MMEATKQQQKTLDDSGSRHQDAANLEPQSHRQNTDQCLCNLSIAWKSVPFMLSPSLWGHVTAPWCMGRKDSAEKSRARKAACVPRPPIPVSDPIREAGAELPLRPKCS